MYLRSPGASGFGAFDPDRGRVLPWAQITGLKVNAENVRLEAVRSAQARSTPTY